MKKIFTLIAVAMMALGAQAQKITFDATEGLKAEYDVDGFKLTYVDTDGKMAVDANSQYFGTAEEYENLGARFKTGGKSSEKNNITLTLPTAGTLKVYVRTASSGATDRNLVLTQSDNKLFDQVIKENEATDYATAEIEGESKKVFPIISVGVNAGTVEVTYPTGSLNFYAFELVAGDAPDTPDPEPAAGLIDYPTSKDGITLGGTTAYDNSQKYHANADAVSNISFANGYTTEGVINANAATLTVEGGFKAGDVVSVAGYFNNTDEEKQAAVTLFVGEEGEAPTDLWTSGLSINGRTNAADPTVETYTLEADYASLKLGRANGLTGATRTNVTLLKVVRGTETGIVELPVTIKTNDAVYNLQGQRVDANYRGIVIKNGKKIVQ